MYTSKTGASRQRPAYVPALSSLSLPSSQASSRSSSSTASYTQFERETTFHYVPKHPNKPIKIGVVNPTNEVLTHTVELPHPLTTMSMFERTNVITHAIAFVVVILYLSIRTFFPGVPSSATLSLFSTVWTVHLLTTVVAGMTFLISTVYHYNPNPYWWVVRLLRSIDVALVIFAIATALFANTCVALAAFWTQLIVNSDAVNSLRCKPAVVQFIEFNWRTIFDALLAGAFAVIYSLLALNSSNKQDSVDIFGYMYSKQRDTRRWGIGDHHFEFQRVCCIMILLLGWIIIAPLDISYIPDNFGIFAVCVRAVGSTFVIMAGLMDSHESIDRMASAAPCAWVVAYVPFSHSVWHVISFIAVFADIIIRDYSISLIVNLYDEHFSSNDVMLDVC